MNREIATAIMKEIGLEVDTAEDGTDAVNIMSSAEGRKYDLILWIFRCRRWMAILQPGRYVR